MPESMIPTIMKFGEVVSPFSAMPSNYTSHEYTGCVVQGDGKDIPPPFFLPPSGPYGQSAVGCFALRPKSKFSLMVRAGEEGQGSNFGVCWRDSFAGGVALHQQLIGKPFSLEGGGPLKHTGMCVETHWNVCLPPLFHLPPAGIDVTGPLVKGGEM